MASSLESIRRQLLKTSILEHEYRGAKLYFRKVDLLDGKALLPRWNELISASKNGKEDFPASVQFYIDFLAATLVDDETLEKDCQSEEQKAVLLSLPVDDVAQLALVSLRHSGLVIDASGSDVVSDAKKNSMTQTGSSCSTSAES
jgi:hypothetical protein